MSQSRVPRTEAVFGSVALMRLLTVVLAVLLVILGVLAAHHAQNAGGETGHVVLAEPETAHLPLAGDGESWPAIAVGEVAVGLATGCVVLVVCCALGLALLASRAWRADLFRRLGNAVRFVREAFTVFPSVTPGARPSLVALSISRT